MMVSFPRLSSRHSDAAALLPPGEQLAAVGELRHFIHNAPAPCSSVATEWVKGKSVDEVLSIKNKDIAAHLKLPPVKLHCR